MEGERQHAFKRRDLMSSDAPKLSQIGFDEAEVKRLLSLPDPLDSVPQSVAVVRCIQSWNRTMMKEVAAGTDILAARRLANASYKMVMPPLVGLANIKDFIACVSHGLLMGTIQSKDSTKLLYAAQVALAAQKSLPKINEM
jgi:hypothetical protein